MSPLSVAQFLKDSPIHFDLVVFDEASQIFTEDAIGAVMRGNQLVVAGDEKQLPPTSFFQASQVDDSDGDEEVDDSTEQPDYESVLAACSTVLPQKMLRWHYRSRHEGLIAFSNARFYESRLVTFPTANDAESEMGVRWVPVPDGIYARGKSRTNAREAERIAELVVEHWRSATRTPWRPRTSAPEKRTRPSRKPSRPSCGRKGSRMTLPAIGAPERFPWQTDDEPEPVSLRPRHLRQAPRRFLRNPPGSHVRPCYTWGGDSRWWS